MRALNLLERRVRRFSQQPPSVRAAAGAIVFTTLVVVVAAGALMRLLDGEEYPSIGLGVWWALQTVTTVGYGDDVPTSFAGQLVAVLVMLLGIGFLTVITAAITSTFVSRSRREQAPSDAETAMAEQFRQLDSRLERIEAALRRPSSS